MAPADEEARGFANTGGGWKTDELPLASLRWAFHGCATLAQEK